MNITTPAKQAAALELRSRFMSMHNLSTQQVSRYYDEVARPLGVKVVWGLGGAQTKRMKGYDEDGTQYIHVRTPTAPTRKKLDIVEGWWK